MRNHAVTTTGTIDGLRRLANTPSGNPRWRVSLLDGRAYVTDSDAAFAQEVGEHMVGMPVILRATRTGLLTDVRLDPARVAS